MASGDDPYAGQPSAYVGSFAQTLAASPSGTLFPSPRKLWAASPAENPDLFSRAPWFDSIACRDERLIRTYVDGAGLLPGDVPFYATQSAEWRLRVAIDRHSLIAHRRQATGCYPECHADRGVARKQFFNRVFGKLQWFAGSIPTPPRYRFDTWFYRTRGEAEYGDQLASLGSIVDTWSSHLPVVRQAAVLYKKSFLNPGFRWVKKQNIPFWTSTVRIERRFRSRLGVLVPWHNDEAEFIKNTQLPHRYIRLPTWWSRWEVPQGCWADLGPTPAYLGTRIIQDPSSGWWSVVLTEWVTHVAAFLLWEVYDTHRLWWIPYMVLESILYLDLSIPLGGAANYAEVRDLMEVLSRVSWNDVPVG